MIKSVERRQTSPSDVGTLWTMQSGDRRARCALFAWPAHWEVRVLVDGQAVRSEDCRRGAEGFAVAEYLKSRMLEQGWKQIVPVRRHRSAVRHGQPVLTLVTRHA